MNSSKKKVWKPVAGYEGLYRVSDNGIVSSIGREVCSISGRMSFRKGIVKAAYYSRSLNGMAVVLSKNGKNKSVSVSGIVANAFVPNPGNLNMVKHVNGDIRDNRCKNLEWHGKVSSSSKKWSDDNIIFIQESKLHCASLAKKFKVSKSTIYAIKNGTHKACVSVKQKV